MSEPLTIAVALLVKSTEDGFTYLHCTCTAHPMLVSDWWVNISKESVISDRITRERLALVHAINIPLAPERYYLKDKEEVVGFTLVFPKTPDHWIMFDFIEPSSSGSGFKAKGIVTNSSGIYRVTL